MDEATFDEIMNVNLKGLFFNVQQALPVLKDHASIILTTTMADQKGYPGTTVYSASKAAVRSLARTLSAELVDRGIRVNAVAPGPMLFPPISCTAASTTSFLLPVITTVAPSA